MDGAEHKRAAAEYAAGLVQSGMRLGLGSGSTVRFFFELLAERLRAGELRDVVGVPTSRETERLARALGIPLSTLAACPELDLAVDGADEVDPALRLIKGLGGAALREKIVASAARRFVVVVDESKLVERLGTRAPLPLEVEPFGEAVQHRFLEALGGVPVLRRGGDGAPFVTDGGHHVIDCRFPDGIPDPERLERTLALRPGILESGLFLGVASRVVVAGAAGVRTLERDAEEAA